MSDLTPEQEVASLKAERAVIERLFEIQETIGTQLRAENAALREEIALLKSHLSPTV